MSVADQMWRECNRLITFVRLSPGSNVSNPSRCYTSEDILTFSTPMAHLDVERNGRASIEHEWGLQVDFANKSIGGGVLQTGHVNVVVITYIMTKKSLFPCCL
eukprot:GHVU01117131.1.p1 GENE.GHVU01117131.1~~GHVU01117131.1.p1  ORF type:complete len:103 (+),score=2.61 GHVU01117131.1:435-743(+)